MEENLETINEEKCNAWCEMLIAFMKMTKDINNSEARYIKAMFAIAFGNLEMQELKEKNIIKDQEDLFMVIEYKTGKYVSENKKIEIEDTKNVFLEGINPYDTLPTFFGIWTKGNCLSIVTITSYRNISYKYWLSTNGCTESHIRRYLEYNDNVKIITKNEFKAQMDYVRSILKI